MEDMRVRTGRIVPASVATIQRQRESPVSTSPQSGRIVELHSGNAMLAARG